MVNKKSGEGGLSLCPYCEYEMLDFQEQEVIGTEIYEIYRCQKCKRQYQIRFTPDDWKEILKDFEGETENRV